MRTIRVVLVFCALLCAEMSSAVVQYMTLAEAALRHPMLGPRFNLLFEPYIKNGTMLIPSGFNVNALAGHVALGFEHYGEGSFDQTMMRRPSYLLSALRHVSPFTVRNTEAHPHAVLNFLTTLVDVIQMEGFRNNAMFSLNLNLMVSPIQVMGYAKSIQGSVTGNEFTLRIDTTCVNDPCEIPLRAEDMQFPMLRNPVVKVEKQVLFRFREDRDNDAWLNNIKGKLSSSATRYTMMSEYLKTILSKSRDFTDVCVQSDLSPLFVRVEGLKVSGKLLKIPLSGHLEEIAFIPRSQKMHLAPAVINIRGKYGGVLPGEAVLSNEF